MHFNQQNFFAIQITSNFPEEGLAYGYRFDDAGVSNLEVDDNDEERKVNRDYLWTAANIIRSIFSIDPFIFLPVLLAQ